MPPEAVNVVDVPEQITTFDPALIDGAALTETVTGYAVAHDPLFTATVAV